MLGNTFGAPHNLLTSFRNPSNTFLWASGLAIRVPQQRTTTLDGWNPSSMPSHGSWVTGSEEPGSLGCGSFDLQPFEGMAFDSDRTWLSPRTASGPNPPEFAPLYPPSSPECVCPKDSPELEPPPPPPLSTSKLHSARKKLQRERLGRGMVAVVHVRVDNVGLFQLCRANSLRGRVGGEDSGWLENPLTARLRFLNSLPLPPRTDVTATQLAKPHLPSISIFLCGRGFPAHHPLAQPILC